MYQTDIPDCPFERYTQSEYLAQILKDLEQSPFMLSTEADAVDLKAAMRYITEQGWEAVVFTPMGSNKPVLMTRPSDWLKAFLDLPDGVYNVTEF